MTKSILTTLVTLMELNVSAQDKNDGEIFNLTKQGAHYVFTASIAYSLGRDIRSWFQRSRYEKTTIRRKLCKSWCNLM